MNRRSFVKGISLALAGVSSSPSIFLPKLIERPVWRRNRWVVNPEWENATHEIEWFIGEYRYYVMDYGRHPVIFHVRDGRHELVTT